MGDEAASSTGDSPPPSPGAAKSAPWRGRKRVPEARGRYVAVRCTETEYASMTAAARRAGLSVGAFLRALGCGNPGLRAARRPPIERQELARLLGHMGKLGSNVNQLAHMANVAGRLRSEHQLNEIGDEVRAMRTALMKALGRGD
jgi:hypothetical protein